MQQLEECVNLKLKVIHQCSKKRTATLLRLNIFCDKWTVPIMFTVPKSSNFSRIILASGSPRRKEILKDKGGILDLIIQPSTYEEECKGLFDPTKVYDYITGIAHGKVLQVAQGDEQKASADYGNTLYIGSDTVVLQGGKIFEKPTSKEDALSMLKNFRDTCTHKVCSGVVLLVPNMSSSNGSDASKFYSHTFHETTDVKFSQWCTDQMLEGYVDTGEPMDKAGGYGIQGLGSQLVESINGDFYNVMGFPLARFCQELNTFIENLEKLPNNMFSKS